MRKTNPILPGFNPDPSIIRVGVDYFIATSTFEWFPGVQIHHSTDLKDWKLITHPLNRVSLLDMKGIPDSCGVWAPCLSYDKGTFYLVYSCVKSFDGMWKDTPNYLTTAKNISGPWSDPVFLSARGFDGSLFHDEDGRKWYLSMLTDHRDAKFFGGIILQEYNEYEKTLVGEVFHVFFGSELGITEAPHLYNIDGYYYLITAEGGTEYGHAVCIARSKKIQGPYTLHPQNPFVSARDNSSHPLQKLGHADIVWTQNNDPYLVCLAARPIEEKGRCTLGRETVIEKLIWNKGEWPKLESGDKLVREIVPDLGAREQNHSEYLDLKKGTSIHYQSLRVPMEESWCKVNKEEGLILTGRDSLSSTLTQSLLARRVQHFDISYTIGLKFCPTSFQQMAGLVCYYNTHHYFYLYKSVNDSAQHTLNLMCFDNGKYIELANQVVDEVDELVLKCYWKNADLQFAYILDNIEIKIGPICDGSILSDDYVREGGLNYRPAFTGSFVGFCCQDLTGQKQAATFTFVDYQENH